MNHKGTLLSSCHPLFDVTGTFNNPGPLGGYLVVGLVVAVLLYAFFEKEYMFYQADYFRNHPQFAFLDVADNVTYPYNELLHIAVETGMCGLVLFLLVVSPFVFSDERTLKAALAAWLIFAMFSYPVNVVPLMMDFALFIELRRGKTVSVLDINRIFVELLLFLLWGYWRCVPCNVVFNVKKSCTSLGSTLNMRFLFHSMHHLL